jgi:ATP-binding cassette subfamily B protein
MIKKISQTFVRQLDGSDCGVACLASVVRFYGGYTALEQLRDLSGTSQQGTTLLGLHQAAGQLGFVAKGLRADSIAQLQESLAAPVILHVRLGEGPQEHHLNHFLVCYRWEPARQRFVIGDPASGILDYTVDELDQRWASKTLLTLQPTEQFERKDTEARRKHHWLLQTVQPDLPALAIATGLGLVTTVMSLVTALFSQQLIDRILPARDVRRLTVGLVLLGTVLLARAALTYLRGWLLTRQSQDLNNRLTNSFFETLLYLPKTFFDSRQTGDFIARLNDTGRIQQAVSHLTGTVIINLLVVSTTLIYIGLHSGLLVGCMVVYLSLYGLVTWHFGRPIQAAQRAAMAAAAVNQSQYIDTLQGIADVKATGQEGLFARLTQALYGHLQAAVYSLRQVGLRFGTVAEILSAGFTTGILALTAYLVVRGTLSLGELVAILSMVGTLVPAVVSLALTNIQLQEAGIAFERMYEYSKNEPELDKDAVADAFDLQQLEVVGLSFSFPGRAALFENLSFRVG